jgi:Ni,Fe-hydrogenase III small subunit
VAVPGCPPNPRQILSGILTAISKTTRAPQPAIVRR